MSQCGAQWGVKFRFAGIVKVYIMNKWVGRCTLPLDHEGKHKCRIRSDINNEVASIEW